MSLANSIQLMSAQRRASEFSQLALLANDGATDCLETELLTD